MSEGVSNERVWPGWLLGLVFLIAAFWPLAVVRDPAMQDYSNHLARAFILLHPDQFREAYAVRWAPIPDLGWDVWALVVGKWLPLHAAAALFFLLYFAAALSGLIALHRAFGNKTSLLPLCGTPFLLNGGYIKGFFSFDLGIALMLWALALWLWLGDERWRLRLVVGTILSTLLYFVHFYAFAVYGLFLLGLELPGRLAKGGKGILLLARDGLQALPAFAFIILAGNHLSLPTTGYQKSWQRLIDVTLLIDTNHVWLNIVLTLAMLGAIVYVLATGRARLPSRLTLPLILCALIYVAIPDTIVGTAYVAWRTVLAAVLVIVAAMAPTGRARITVPLLTLSLAITLLSSTLFAANAARTEDERQVFLKAIAPMPEGARLFWAHSGGTQHALLAQAAGTYHMGSEAVEARHAVVQSMFTYSGQQVLEFRDPRLSVPGNAETFLPVIAQGFNARHQDLKAYIGLFDYVLLEGPGDPVTEAKLPRARLKQVNQVGDFRLYAVEPSNVTEALKTPRNP